MFNLRNKKMANNFYCYAKALAILRENLHDWGLSTKVAKTWKLIEEVAEAIRILVKNE